MRQRNKIFQPQICHTIFEMPLIASEKQQLKCFIKIRTLAQTIVFKQLLLQMYKKEIFIKKTQT